MGTKVHCKSYLPGYYTMTNFNGDANGSSWPLYYEDKSLRSGQYYNGFLPRPTMDGYLGCDKEVLKQTMLKHENIFRNQVYELHRLYGIQRNLMDGMKKKELHKYPIPVETSQSNSFSLQMPPEHVQKTWHIPSLPLVHSTCNRPSVSGTDDIQSLSLMKGKGPVPVRNASSSKDCELLESKSKKSWRRLFDLQLPADEYIDSEEGERFEEGKLSEVTEVASYPRDNYEVAPETEVKLTLGSGVNPIWQGEASRSNSCLRSRVFADLNEPVQVEELTASVSLGSFGPFPVHGETQRRDPSSKLDSGFQGWYKEFFPNTQNRGNTGSQSNLLHLGNNGNKPEWLSYNSEAGNSRSNPCSIRQGFCPEKLPTSEPVQLELKKSREFTCIPSDQSKGLQVSERIHDLSNYTRSGTVVASQNPLVNRSVIANSDSSSVSSWRRPVSSLNQIAVQSLPCFNNSVQLSKCSNPSNQMLGISGDKWHLNNGSSSIPSFRSEESLRNGFCHEYQSEYKAPQVCFPSTGFDCPKFSNGSNSSFEHFLHHGPPKYIKGSDRVNVKPANDMNLNAMAPQQDLVSIGDKRKHEDPPGGLPWLRAKLACNGKPDKDRGDLIQMELDFLNTCPPQSTNKHEIVEIHPILVNDSRSTACASDAEPKRNNVDDCSNNRKILGFPIFDKPSKEHSCSEVVNFENGGKGVLDFDLARDPTSLNSEKQLKLATENLVAKEGLDRNLAVFKIHLNLNKCINEEESSSTPSLPRAIMKIAAQIDLEAPVIPGTEEVIPHGEEPRGNQPEEHVRIAAEAIISISSSGVHNSSDDDPSEASLRDSLLWFADTICSYMGDPESGVVLVFKGRRDGGDDHEEENCNGFDYFESMTLKLTETKVEEYWCKLQVPETGKEEDTGVSLLLSRPRKGKGQARRGRQRKDFQSDILPGLASLSRHEVTEDLQTIGGLMKATGHPWESGLTRRNATRNGWARGRRRTRGPTPSVSATVVYSLPRHQPHTTSELGLEEGSLTGWGKTTRRPRRQRCPAMVSPLPLSKV